MDGFDEERLPGGNVGGGVVRIGATVRRRTGPWTPAVHDLLAHLASSGLAAIPRVHGIDEHGREVLDYLPGEVVDVDTTELSDDRLRALAAWTGQFHAAVASFPRTARHWYFGDRRPTDGEVICHNDLAPYNVAFDGDRVAGVFDWELAGPGTPIGDLGHIVWNAVPLFRPVPATDLGWLEHRLGVIVDGYGAALTPAELAASAIKRLRVACDRIAAGQAAGDAGMVRLAAVGEPARTRRRIAEAVARLAPLGVR